VKHLVYMVHRSQLWTASYPLLNTLAGYPANHTKGITKVFHKEMADFNVRTLLVYLGTFNTPMVDKVNKISNPVDPDYEGTTVMKLMNFLSSGKIVAPGDHLKAVKAIYEVVMGEGVGKGNENEMFLPLGVDMAGRFKESQDRLAHTMEVFGEICNNVNVAEDQMVGTSRLPWEQN
jgi:hypothetical protein